MNQCLGEESYTLSDLRKSFEEQNFILILKIFQKLKLFSRKSMVDLILHVGIESYDKEAWRRSSAIYKKRGIC